MLSALPLAWTGLDQSCSHRSTRLVPSRKNLEDVMGSPSITDRTLAVIGLVIAAAGLYLAYLAYLNSLPRGPVPPGAPPAPTPKIEEVVPPAPAPAKSVEVESRVLSSYSGQTVSTATPAPRVPAYEPPPAARPHVATVHKPSSIAVAPPPKPSLSTASTALISATRLGNHDDVKRWLASGADPNAVLEDGKTPLMYAAQNGDHDICDTLVRRGALTTLTDQRGRNALHYAAENGHNDLVKYLLDHGAPAAAMDNEGNTPLTLAMRSGHNTCASAIRKVLRVMEISR